MNIITRIKHWYYRPRYGKMFGFMNWVLTDTQALNKLMVMSHIVSIILFGVLSYISFVWDWNWLSRGVFLFVTLVCVRNLYRYVRYSMNKVEGISLNDLVGKRGN